MIKLKPYLEKRGLAFAEEKTKVTRINEGFDFLGFNLRQYKTNQGMKLLIIRMSWISIVRHSSVKYTNSPDDASLKEYFEKRDVKEFIRDNVMSRRKLAKQSNYKCRVCKKSLVSEETLKINQIVPYKYGS